MSSYKTTIITSVNKAVDVTRLIGKLDLDSVTIYDLFRYYEEFTRDNPLFKEDNLKLKDYMFSLKYSNPSKICNYKKVVGNSTITIGNPDDNTPPVVAGFTIDLEYNTTYTFTVQDFLDVYLDAENDPAFTLTFIPIISPNFRTLYNGVELTAPVILPINNIPSLTVERLDNNIIILEDGAYFRMTDAYSYSNTALIGYEASQVDSSNNEPATIGDNAIYALNRFETILTLEMFTSGLKPPYNDPENDLIDAIRIDEVSTANEGEFKFNGMPVMVGQIITREELELELFTHEGADSNTIETDAINFSARDEGSLVWVQ